jgi:hypothetical protein
LTTFLVPKNNASSRLSAAITAGATSLTLAAGEGARFPATFPYHITIDSEILKVTARSTDTMTVERAMEATTAAAHNAAAAVQLNITAQAISDLNTAVNARIEHSLATAADDMLMASGAGAFIKKTLAETKTKLGIASDIATHAALQTGIHGFTDFILEDTTARTYAANTWYTIGGAFYAQQVFLLVGVHVVNPDAGQGGAGHWMSVGFGMTGLVGWQNATPTIPFVFPLHGHNWSDLNCSLMPTTDGNGTHHLQIMFSGNVPVCAGGFVRLYCKSLFGMMS